MSRSFYSICLSFGFLSSFSVLTSCGPDAKKLKAENDSLRIQLRSSSKVVETMKTVKVLLDSIDLTRHTVHTKDPNDSIANYSVRMTDLKDYVKQTENKIRELEASLVESDVNKDSYMMIIDALKDELKLRNEEIGIIEDNEELKTAVDVKNTQLQEIEEKLDSKKEELKLVELRIKELVRAMNISAADSYFAQAGAVEEAAKRTKLAPNKKRDTYLEALELYQKALKAGKKEAKVKVAELTDKLGKEISQ